MQGCNWACASSPRLDQLQHLRAHRSSAALTIEGRKDVFACISQIAVLYGLHRLLLQELHLGQQATALICNNAARVFGRFGLHSLWLLDRSAVDSDLTENQ